MQHSRKIQQKDSDNCGPITIFNIKNLTQDRKPDATSVHIPTKKDIGYIRTKAHNAAYLAIKEHTDYNSTVNETERIQTKDLEAAEDDNWFTDNLINLLTKEIITHQEHTILSSRFYEYYITKRTHSRLSKEIIKGKQQQSLILPILNDKHWITVVITKNLTPTANLNNDRNSKRPTVSNEMTRKHITIVSQNINGKYIEAANNLDIETY